MSNNTSFEIIRFMNHSGAMSWRLSGWLASVRVRRNFKTREEAAAEKQTLEIRAMQVAAGFRVATTSLTDVQLRAAEDALRRLDGRPHSILFYLEYALTNYREPSQEKPLSEAVAEYLATKVREVERTLLSSVQVQSIKNELKHLQLHFPSGPARNDKIISLARCLIILGYRACLIKMLPESLGVLLREGGGAAP